MCDSMFLFCSCLGKGADHGKPLDENEEKRTVDDVKDFEETKFGTLRLDVDYYQTLLDDVEIPEDKKREMIETLWQIVVSFVSLGFDVHPLQQAEPSTENMLHPEMIKMIEDAANQDSTTLKEAWPERSEAQ